MDQKTRRSGHPAQIKMRKYPVAAETMVMLPVSPKPLCKPKCCTFSGTVHADALCSLQSHALLRLNRK